MDVNLKRMFDRAPSRPTIVRRTPQPYDHLIGILSDDPMSPYAPIVTKSSYANIADVMNHKGFSAVYPESYTPISDYYIKNNIVPYYNPGQDDDYSTGRLTVAGMVELCAIGAAWKIIRDEDIEDILAIATAYVNSMDTANTSQGLYDRMHAKNTPVKEYITKVRKMIQMVEKVKSAMYRRKGLTSPTSIDIVSILSKLIRGYTK